MLFRFRYQMLRFRHSSVPRGNYVFRAGAGDVGTDVFGSSSGGRCVSESSQQWGRIVRRADFSRPAGRCVSESSHGGHRLVLLHRH